MHRNEEGLERCEGESKYEASKYEILSGEMTIDPHGAEFRYQQSYTFNEYKCGKERLYSQVNDAQNGRYVEQTGDGGGGLNERLKETSVHARDSDRHQE